MSDAVRWLWSLPKARSQYPLHAERYPGIYPKNNMLQLFEISFSVFFQVLCIYDKLDAIDVEAAVNYIAGLQNSDGSFSGICLKVDLEV